MRILTAVLLAAVCSARASTVNFYLTNFTATGLSNIITLVPQGPVTSGSTIISGLPIRITPVNSSATTNLLAGTYQFTLQGITFPRALYLIVPDDTNTYSAAQLITNNISSSSSPSHVTPAQLAAATNGYVRNPITTNTPAGMTNVITAIAQTVAGPGGTATNATVTQAGTGLTDSWNGLTNTLSFSGQTFEGLAQEASAGQFPYYNGSSWTMGGYNPLGSHSDGDLVVWSSGGWIGSNVLSSLLASKLDTNSTVLAGKADKYRSGGGWQAFGDSITYGQQATASNLCWVARVASALGRAVTNRGYSAQEIQYLSTRVFTSEIATNDGTFLLTGYNDMRHAGLDPATGLPTYRDALRSMIAYCAIPHSHKVLRDDVTFSANQWTNFGTFDVWDSKFTDTAGATATFTVYGTAAYVCWINRVGMGSGGTFTITVDGTVLATVDANAGIADNASTTFWPSLTRISGLTNGAHTVVMTAAGDGYVDFEWAAGNAFAASDTLPAVFSAGPLRMNTNGYALGASLWNGGSNRAVEDYNAINRTVCAEFASDGLNVSAVDAYLHYNPDTGGMVHDDNVHPNDLGHGIIAASFTEAVESRRRPAPDYARTAGSLPSGTPIQTALDDKIGTGQTNAFATDILTQAAATAAQKTNATALQAFLQPLDADLAALAGIEGVNGDIIIFNDGWKRLAKGSENQVLKMGAALPAWGADATGGGGGAAPDIETYQQTVVLFDELIHKPSTAQMVGPIGFAISGVTQSTTDISQGPGVLAQSAAPGAISYMAAVMDQYPIALGAGTYTNEWRIKTSALSDGANNFTTRIGFGNSLAAATEATDAIYFRLSSTNGNYWMGVCREDGTETTPVQVAAAAANTWYRLRIVVNADASLVTFTVNDGTPQTVNSNIPDTGDPMTVMSEIVNTEGTGNRIIYTDYCYLGFTLTTSR